MASVEGFLLKKFEVIAIGIIIVLGVAATAIAVYDLLSPPRSNQTTSLPFVEQPVVDVIVPSLYRNQGSNNVNSPINVTAGQTLTFVVDIYTSVSLNLTMEFKLFSPFGQSTNSSLSTTSVVSTVRAYFSPTELTIQGAGKGSTNLTLGFSSSALPGNYNSVISAVNLNNSSQVWGDVVQVSIRG